MTDTATSQTSQDDGGCEEAISGLIPVSSSIIPTTAPFYVN